MKSPIILFLFILTIATIGLLSCTDGENLSPVPEITFIGMNKDTMVQSFFNDDTVQVAFSFVDGDGDIGNLENSSRITLFIEDLRTGELYDRFAIPAIPSNGNTLRGEMFVSIFTSCCVFPENIPPCEAPEEYPSNDLELQITLFDRAGNSSNVIRTPKIKLLCK